MSRMLKFGYASQYSMLDSSHNRARPYEMIKVAGRNSSASGHRITIPLDSDMSSDCTFVYDVPEFLAGA